MNRKGQTIGTFIVTFVAILVGIILLIASADLVAVTSLTAVQNDSLVGSTTVPASGATIDLQGQELQSTPRVTNASGFTIPAANYTIDEGVSATTGVKTVQYTADTAELATDSINISYTYGADGYADDPAARAIIPLIIIMMALAIVVVALDPVLKSQILGVLGR